MIWYGVIPRGDLLDLADQSFEAVAWFRHEHHAHMFGRQYWYDFYTVVEGDGPVFGGSKNKRARY